MRKISLLIGAMSILALVVGVTAQGQADLSTSMKGMVPALQGLKKAIDEKNSAEALKQSDAIGKLFKSTDETWSKEKLTQAAQWSKDAQMAAAEATKAIKANNWDEALKAHGGVQKTCKACHDVHREKTDAGYKLKK